MDRNANRVLAVANPQTGEVPREVINNLEQPPVNPHVKHALCNVVRRINHRQNKYNYNRVRESGGLWFEVRNNGRQYISKGLN
jgi:hypothetical protein